MSLLWLDFKGEELKKVNGHYQNADFVRILNETANENANRYFKVLEAELSSAKPAAVPGVLQRIALVPGKSSAATLLEYGKKEDASAAIRTAAVEGLGKQTEGAEDLVALLADKLPAVRSAAAKALTAQGPAAVPALFGGLESENADVRAACYTIAAATTKFPGSKFGGFWKTGEADARKDVLAKWREYWDKKKPAAASAVN